MPSRSRLYCLAPVGKGTSSVESLTSYIHRLAWTYRVTPRTLVRLEVVPHLTGPHQLRSSPHRLGSFGRGTSMSVNGTGEIAVDWSDTLGQLTMRSDLRNLTLHPWASGLPAFGLLRAHPAWCPVCYHAWQEQAFPLYQPLVWMLQVVKICPRHKQWLEDHCPSCQKHQSAIGANMHLGHCTQCARWLGMQPGTRREKEISNEMLCWQEWVVSTVGELHQVSVFSGSLSWESFLEGLATCAKIVGNINRLAHVADVSYPVLSKWLSRTRAPSFEVMLQCCYVLGVSPLHLMADDPVLLRNVLDAREPRGKPLPKRSISAPVDSERALALIQAVLDGREQLLSVHQIEQHLGLGSHILQKKFPQECAMLVAKYRAYRNERARQRIAQTCTAVRQATLTLYEQGVTPTWKRVTTQLA
ncbi:MAG TPA: TniQ family protein, partial [Ktedonobacteraceae bacterium]